MWQSASAAHAPPPLGSGFGGGGGGGGGGGRGGGGGGSGGLPGLRNVLNAPVAMHLAGTQEDRRQQPLSTPLLEDAFANITTQWQPGVASQ